MDFQQFDPLIDTLGAARVIAHLASFITDERRARIEAVLAGRVDAVHVAVERPEDPYNAAAIVRSAEALGAMHVHAVDAPDDALHARKTTQGSFNWVHTYHHPTLEALLALLRARGVRLYGAHMRGKFAVDALPVDAPLCLLFGNEGVGLSERALAACDDTFHIPMYGMSESLNLSVSAALSLRSALGRRRALVGRDGDLDDAALLREKARYYARCVDARTLDALASASTARDPLGS
ncbi:MAG: RNA methyltransferase [Polyangiales bacterium]